MPFVDLVGCIQLAFLVTVQHGRDQLGCSGDAVSQVRKIHLFAVARKLPRALRTAGNLGKLSRHFTLGSGEQHNLALDHGSKFVLADTNLVVAPLQPCRPPHSSRTGTDCAAVRPPSPGWRGSASGRYSPSPSTETKYILRHNIISFTGQYKYKSNYTHKQSVSQRILRILFTIHHFD